MSDHSQEHAEHTEQVVQLTHELCDLFKVNDVNPTLGMQAMATLIGLCIADISDEATREAGFTYMLRIMRAVCDQRHSNSTATVAFEDGKWRIN